MSNSSDYWHVQIRPTVNTNEIFIEVIKDVSYILHEQVPIHLQYIVPDCQGVVRSYENAESFKLDPKTYLCRCGMSKNQLYCHDSHMLPSDFGMGSVSTRKNSILTFTVLNMLCPWRILFQGDTSYRYLYNICLKLILKSWKS